MGARITWLGHSTVLIETAGTRLLTDPILRLRVAHLRRRPPAPPVPAPLDGVLISHAHDDHLDVPSLRRVAASSLVAAINAGAGDLLRRLPFGRVAELRAGEATTIARTRVEAVPAWHPARRRPWAPRLEAVGYLVDGIWFAGDTDLHDDMRELRGRVRVALVPVWGWGPSLGPGHLDPEAAAQAVALVRPEVAIPIHWGTFLPIGSGERHRRILVEPPAAFAAHAERLARGVSVVRLEIGGSLAV